MAMTKKHFEEIAQIIKDNRITGAAAGFDEGYDAAVQTIADALTVMFEADNPRFDSARFLTAAGCAAGCAA